MLPEMFVTIISYEADEDFPVDTQIRPVTPYVASSSLAIPGKIQ